MTNVASKTINMVLGGKDGSSEAVVGCTAGERPDRVGS